MVRYITVRSSSDLITSFIPPAGHYLNLPVIEADGRLIAVVDVLKLTYATLEQINTLAAGDAQESAGGPLWGRFFESIAANDETESAISGSHMRSVETPPPIRQMTMVEQSPHSELAPGDSASAVNDDGMDEFPALPSKTVGDASVVSGARVDSLTLVDDGTYVFKFRTPSGYTHRFQARKDDIDNLRDIVGGKLEADPFFTNVDTESGGFRPDPRQFHLAYTDLDGDSVTLSSNGDVEDAVKIARKAGVDRVVLHLHGGKSWNAPNSKSDEAPKSTMSLQRLPSHDEADTGVGSVNFAPPAKVHVPDSDTIYGIPKDLVLPASIAALAAVIVGVFTISRLTRD